MCRRTSRWAREWYEKAATRRAIPDAEFMLGVLYEGGHGVAKSPARARDGTAAPQRKAMHAHKKRLRCWMRAAPYGNVFTRTSTLGIVMRNLLRYPP